MLQEIYDRKEKDWIHRSKIFKVNPDFKRSSIFESPNFGASVRRYHKSSTSHHFNIGVSVEFTGERPVLDNGTESSKMRYRALLPYCLGKEVLDYGCGIGHGSHWLSTYLPRVVGYEPCKEALDCARKNFSRSNLDFVECFDPHLVQGVDLVVMVEVLEHIEKEQVASLLEVFRESGKDLILTTPNGELYPYHPATKEDRRGFHLWHYTCRELQELGAQYFKFSEVFSHLWDPNIKQFISYMMICSNRFS